MRQHRDKNVPVVVMKRKKIQEKGNCSRIRPEENGTVTAMQNPFNGVKRTAPVRPIGEDDTSIEKQKTNMKTEFKRKVKDYQLIEKLMQITYADRRKWIVLHTPSLNDIQEQYPCLFSNDQVQQVLKLFHSIYVLCSDHYVAIMSHINNTTG